MATNPHLKETVIATRVNAVALEAIEALRADMRASGGKHVSNSAVVRRAILETAQNLPTPETEAGAT